MNHLTCSKRKVVIMKKIVIYPENCTGCRLCESSCAIYNENVNDLSRARIRTVKDHLLGLSVPVVCHQCKDPPCAEGCPVNSIIKDLETGIVKINYDECIGCETCIQACPFGAIIALQDKVIKCELCNGDPQCVRYCATEAIKYIDASEASREQRVKGAEKSMKKRIEILNLTKSEIYPIVVRRRVLHALSLP